MDEVILRIMNAENWPNIELSENLELLNEIADEIFSTQTFSGMLSAVLMYHQLIEAMCLHLLDDCHFLIQLLKTPKRNAGSLCERATRNSELSQKKKNT